MSGFPRITSPCPYKGPLSDILDQEAVCRLCHRQVHNLSDMSDGQRAAFLKACSGDVCVTYRLPFAAAAVALAAMATPVAAQEQPTASDDETVVIHGSDDIQEVFITGGIQARPLVNTDQPIQIIAAADFNLRGGQTQADAARQRWDETHRRLDSRKGREKRG